MHFSESFLVSVNHIKLLYVTIWNYIFFKIKLFQLNNIKQDNYKSAHHNSKIKSTHSATISNNGQQN